MGIQKEVAAYIAAMPWPTHFSVCELGDQGMCGEPTKRLASDFYTSLGCGRYVSIDGNGRATVAADLNLPLDLASRPFALERFDLVTDFGTGEHIFDQAQVWRTLHDLCKPGGFIAFDRPSEGYPKHCFYVTNECLYRDIAAANDYEVVWLTQQRMPRGHLIRGVFKKPLTEVAFRVPQQSRYRGDLVIAS